MSETTITVTTWTCDICGGETTSGTRPAGGWADITLWHNPGPDTKLMIGADCWKAQVGSIVETKDPRYVVPE